MKTDEIINYLIDNGELVDQEVMKKIKLIIEDKYATLQSQKKYLSNIISSEFPSIDLEKFISTFLPESSSNASVQIIKSYEKTPLKRSVQDFVRYFNIRFKSLEKLLKNRAELSSLISIGRLKGKNERDKVSIIGMVLEKDQTKNGHFIVTLEDLTGITKVLINKDNKELIEIGKDLVLDEVIGINGVMGGDIVFSNQIIRPDIPLSKELKKSPYDHYAVFSGDFHFGSNVFLKKEFTKFLLWLNGKTGSLEQRQMAKKVKYLFMVGDVIEGAGIYPGQEHDLEIEPVEDQYKEAAKYLSKIPKHIKIIICPGNHDVGRIAEPQLPIDREYAQSLWDLENVIMVSNPSYLTVDASKQFPGIDVLMYHGMSLVYYADNIGKIRAAGGQKCADDIMEHMLKMRHLAPTHGSTLYVPDIAEDALVIDKIPDIFVTGHIHRTQTKNYRNVTCINSSCWTEITDDQEKRGLEPQPARAVCVSLKTRDVKVMNFGAGQDATSVSELRRMKEEASQKVKQTS